MMDWTDIIKRKEKCSSCGKEKTTPFPGLTEPKCVNKKCPIFIFEQERQE